MRFNQVSNQVSMTKKRKRKQNDAEYSAGRCDDLAKVVHGKKIKTNHASSMSADPRNGRTADATSSNDLQVEHKPLQLLFKPPQSKKRLVYFKYPEELPSVRLQTDQINTINSMFEQFLKDHPEYQIAEPTKRSKKCVKSETEQKPKLIRRLILFGLNEIVRKIPSKQIAFILLLDPLTTHLQNVILEIAFRNQVPLAFVSSLDGICDMFRLSTAMCVAFTRTALEPDSVIKSVYDHILDMYENQRRIALDQLVLSQSACRPKKTITDKTTQEIPNVDSLKSSDEPKSDDAKTEQRKCDNKIKFTIPLPEFVYTLKSKPIESLHKTSSIAVDRSNALGTFTVITSSKDDHFPIRRFHAPFVH